MQEGTSPLVKRSGGKAKRDFLNFQYPTINAADHIGPRSIIEGGHKPVIRDWSDGKSPAIMGKKVLENFLPRENYQGHKDLRYPDAVTWFGALKVARETGDNDLAGKNLYLCQWNSGKVPPYKLHRLSD